MTANASSQIDSNLGRARRGASGALNPKSAYAGLNILIEALHSGSLLCCFGEGMDLT